MREVKFRGKSLYDGDMRDGYYVYSEYLNKHYLIQDASKSYDYEKTGGINFCHFAEIDINTLGQYTGLKDRKGKEIFEGDIIEYNGNIGDVKFGEIEIDAWNITCWHMDINTEYYKAKYHLNNKEYEIIGNIYKNPELINNNN